ncbi:low-density lipoprotein receptor-related protein 4-like isoform X2 [Anneissia japonica]|uniref:low-density lipoprotein receptor-related protein 4-like isoform X2 n=1 Tax=Anneissia japonica TaxID=1529436 RepID=UPI0014258698|nr:low-density lipoprotein receptor-related protein 4-like isoform X2 [Anneissia japonica]
MIKSIYVVRIEGGQYSRIIHTYTSGRVDGMAVDWISLKVYWVDYLQNLLMVSSYDGMSKSTMFYDIVSPRAIAVDPNARLIYWTEQTSPTKLVRCNLDGTNRQDLINTNLLNPSGIALDHAQRRVYIVGEDSMLIYYIDYDGIEQVNIVGSSTYPAKDITVFQDFIILAGSYGQQSGVIEAIHKVSGSHEGRINVNTTVYAIDTFDESTQPTATLTTAPTITTTSPLSSTTQTKVTTTPKIVITTSSLSTRQTTGHVTSVGADATQEMETGNDSILIIGGASGGVALLIIFLIVILIVLVNKQKRPHKYGDNSTNGLTSNSEDQYATHLPQGRSGPNNHTYDTPNVKLEPPTYESSIADYGRKKAIGESPYSVTKLVHQFNTPNTVALYSKSKPVPVAVGNSYVRRGSHPPQYAHEDANGYLEMQNVMPK